MKLRINKRAMTIGVATVVGITTIGLGLAPDANAASQAPAAPKGIKCGWVNISVKVGGKAMQGYMCVKPNSIIKGKKCNTTTGANCAWQWWGQGYKGNKYGVMRPAPVAARAAKPAAAKKLTAVCRIPDLTWNTTVLPPMKPHSTSTNIASNNFFSTGIYQVTNNNPGWVTVTVVNGGPSSSRPGCGGAAGVAVQEA